MRRSMLIAGGLALGLGAWLATGELRSADPPPAASAIAARPATSLFKVAVRVSTAGPVAREILVNGRTEPARKVEMKAEVAGRITAVPGVRGEPVGEGQLIVQIDERDRQAKLRMAKASLTKWTIENDAAQRLRAKGFQAETVAAETAASLEQSRAAVEAANIEVDNTRIRAPFAGTLDQRPVEIGDFVEPGDSVAVLIELDPLLVTGDLAESDAPLVRPGMDGEAITVGGDRLRGKVRYVASEADPATRTFRFELLVANPAGRIGSGISAQIRLPIGSIPAHEISASHLVLDDEGRLGVQTVDSDDTVRFVPARIVRSAFDAVWLADLPPTVRIVTVGQGFVRPGQRVAPVDDAISGPAASAGGA